MNKESSDVISEISIGIETTNSILERYKLINDCLKKSLTDNNILLTEEVFANEIDLMFTMNNIALLYGDEALNEFQLSYASRVIHVIKNKIPYEEVQLNINANDDGVYYITLSTIINDRSYPLIYLNHYLKYIYIAEDEQTNEILYKIKELEGEVASLEDYLDRLAQSKDNPIHLAGDNSLKMVDMMLRKKKYAEEAVKETSVTLDNINQYHRQIAYYKSLISEMDFDRTKASMLIDKYVDRLTKYFKFTLIKNDEGINTESVEISSYDELDFSQLDFSNNL